MKGTIWNVVKRSNGPKYRGLLINVPYLSIGCFCRRRFLGSFEASSNQPPSAGEVRRCVTSR